MFKTWLENVSDLPSPMGSLQALKTQSLGAAFSTRISSALSDAVSLSTWPSLPLHPSKYSSSVEGPLPHASQSISSKIIMRKASGTSSDPRQKWPFPSFGHTLHYMSLVLTSPGAPLTFLTLGSKGHRQGSQRA